MDGELISVGTEILLGNITNTNAVFLSEMCARLGISLYYHTVVGDNEGRLREILKQACSRSKVVIVTGGLGPTEDDLTKETAASVLGYKLVEDAHTKKRIESFFKSYVKNNKNKKITENNWKQALVPKGAKVLDNHNGTAPGLIMEHSGGIVILLPGPPGEMKPMFQESVYPYLHKMQPEIIYSQMVKICGIGESQVEDDIKDLIKKQKNPTIAPYAKTGEVHLRVTARAKDEKEAKKMCKPIVRELKARFGKNIYAAEEEKTLEDAVVELLASQNLTLAAAESCTGGMLAARIVNVPGASKVLKEGFVTYSDRAKRKRLLVKKGTLAKEGAVSSKTANEMAKGGCFASGADVCISITGIAGPDGGSKEKPVGTVFMGCCYKGDVYVKEFHFTGNREKIREYTTVNALIFLRDTILQNFKKK